MKQNNIRLIGSIISIALMVMLAASCNSTSTSSPTSSTPTVSPVLSSTPTPASSTAAVSSVPSSPPTPTSSTPAVSPLLYSLSITPVSPDNLAIGSTQQFMAVGTYSDNSSVDVTSQVAWTSSNESVASIDHSGLATGIAAGTTKINAFLSGLTSPTITLTVIAPATYFITTPTITPITTPTILPSISPTGYPLPSETPTGVPTITPVESPTTAALPATSPITPMLLSVSLSPASPNNLAAGLTQQFTASGTYSDGSTADITSQVTWTSSNGSVASIDSSGLATGLAAGDTDITASLSGVNSPAVTLTVD